MPFAEMPMQGKRHACGQGHLSKPLLKRKFDVGPVQPLKPLSPLAALIAEQQRINIERARKKPRYMDTPPDSPTGAEAEANKSPKKSATSSPARSATSEKPPVAYLINIITRPVVIGEYRDQAREAEARSHQIVKAPEIASTVSCDSTVTRHTSVICDNFEFIDSPYVIVNLMTALCLIGDLCTHTNLYSCQ